MLERIRKLLASAKDAPPSGDLAREIDHHIAMLEEERLGLGASQEEAEAYARRKFGNRTSISEAVHEMRARAFLDTHTNHLRMAIRSFQRNKSVYASACAILALGSGISIAMFSMVEAVLLRPLPFPDQSSIQVIWKSDALAGNHVEELAYPELRDLQESIPDFEFVAVMPTSLYGYSRVLDNGKSDPVQIEGSPVSHDFFRVLGIAPVLGRDFAALDEHPGAPPVVIVSDGVWRNQLGADPKIVGHMVRLNGQGYTVIGVMAAGVEFPRGAGLWFPLGVDPAVVQRRGATFLQAIARAKSGIPSGKIGAEVNALFQRLAADHPEVYTKSQRAVVTPLVEYWTGSARIHLWIMLAASLLLLVASAISAGNLLLSRALRRRHEITTRLALGARRPQILAQFAAEGILAAIVSAGAGLAVAQAAIRILVRWAPGDIPRLPQAALDPRSFGFAAGIAALAALACTVIPGWTATRMHVESALREGGARLSPSRGAATMRYLFVAAHSTVAMMLLGLAALLVLSYRAMMSADIGFANRDAVSMNLQLHGPGLFAPQAFDAKYRSNFYRELLDKLRRQPGVSSAAAVLLRPLEGTIGWDVSWEFEFDAANRNNRVLPKANYEVVTPGYFETVGTPLVEGRDFSEHDSENSEPVAIISQSLASRIRQAGHRPLGSRIRLGLSHDRWTRIIGVCADARYRSITQAGSDLFVPYLQAAPPTNYVVIRGRQSADELANLVRRTLSSIDHSQTIAGVATVGELIDANSARHRFNMMLLLWFGVCSTILAAGAIYSVVTELITDREHEIRIKTALGAPRVRLAREMVVGTLGVMLAGEVAGALGVWGATGFAAELFYKVSAQDPFVVVSAALILFVLSVPAGVWPAWRAASPDNKSLS
ncbi:MAG TPA: ADOP family duplicated permease [Bryobacteraceae bacterium]|nr:ADOP family duplicated permease [Bryobacteraceae bacterium]